MPLAVGSRLGHYEIVSAIGAGGMGEVYRATDTKLGRAVALKVISPDMASERERLDRFRREAKALAALDHPSIVTVFSVEEDAGVHFLTMQLVEGQSLDRAIPEGGMPIDRIVHIASAVADALVAAHDKGIVHRDLKPANVMVGHDGRVKVLDFGLAKELGPSDPMDPTLTSADHTKHGVVLGTPAYMSPEQIAGRVVDHRTDIFSLGVLLYQMACGRRPFEGNSSMELASAILRDTPLPITQLRGDVSSDLARLIRRCLEKDVQHRLQTARDVVSELREIARLPVSAGPPSSGAARRGGADEGFWVAVLPFKYTGTHPDLAVLADGFSEEIVTGLSRFSYLRVIARSSTTRYASTSGDVRSVGKEIGARYVMEGSLRQGGTQLRVAVQLVETTSGAHLWAETYNRRLDSDELFALQDDLVPRIVSTVADWFGVLPRSMSEALRSRRTDHLTPYEAVLRSFGYSERRTPEEHAIARAALERAVQHAPGYADAWALLSYVHCEEYATGFNATDDPLGRALHAAQCAAEAAPSNCLAQSALARTRFFRKEFQAFRLAAERAIALNPMDGGTMAHMGVYTAYAGEWERGCDMVQRAMQLNPRHPGWYWFPLFYSAYRKRDYPAALTVALKIDLPHFFFSHVALAAVHGQLGNREAAAEVVRELLLLRPDFAGIARDELDKWYPRDLVDHLIDGLRKAGLDVPAITGRASSTSSIARNGREGD